MKILVYGAGVLGCNLARNLFRAGKDVVLLARGKWAEEIRTNGLRIKDKFSPCMSVSRIPVVTELKPDEAYDVIFVVLRYTQLDSILETLRANRTKNLVFVGNDVRARALAAALPEFEKEDRFQMNIVNAAMLGAFILNMPQRPDVDRLTDYYAKAMMTGPMRWFCRKSGKKKFTEADLAGMRATAALRAADRNPYSWNMDLLEYPDGSGYEARFTQCGICALMKDLGLYDLTPAMCHLDYTMSEAGETADFVREYTLASGGPYCDCGYKRKPAAQHRSNC